MLKKSQTYRIDSTHYILSKKCLLKTWVDESTFSEL